MLYNRGSAQYKDSIKYNSLVYFYLLIIHKPSTEVAKLDEISKYNLKEEAL